MTDILRRARLVRREIFEPTNALHVESFKTFLITNNWGDVQFYPEAPFTEAPATVLTKYARHILGVEPETPAEREKRLQSRNVLPMPVLNYIDTPEETAAHLRRLNKLAA